MRIQAALLLNQCLVRAGLHNLAFLHHDDAVGVAHCAQAVGNDEHAAAFANADHVALDDGFAFIVEGAGGLVQNQDAWVGK